MQFLGPIFLLVIRGTLYLSLSKVRIVECLQSAPSKKRAWVGTTMGYLLWDTMWSHFIHLYNLFLRWKWVSFFFLGVMISWIIKFIYKVTNPGPHHVFRVNVNQCSTPMICFMYSQNKFGINHVQPEKLKFLELGLKPGFEGEWPLLYWPHTSHSFVDSSRVTLVWHKNSPGG